MLQLIEATIAIASENQCTQMYFPLHFDISLFPVPFVFRLYSYWMLFLLMYISVEVNILLFDFPWDRISAYISQL